MALVCQGLGLRYGGASAFQLADIDLAVQPGQLWAIAGVSGSGKSSLLGCLAGNLLPGSGTVSAQGVPALTGDEQVADVGYRRLVGLVGQSPERQLFAATALEDVMFGPRNMGLDEDAARAAAEGALEAMGFDADRAAACSPFAYSGGEQRRLAIAGMLALNTPFLLLDEPTAGLDPAQAENLLDLLAREAEAGRGIVMVSHDMDAIARYASHVMLLADGRCVAQGECASVLFDDEAMAGAGLPQPVHIAIAQGLRRRGMPINCTSARPQHVAVAIASCLDCAARRREGGA